MDPFEVRERVKLRPLTNYERQKRHRYPGVLDPRLTDLMFFCADLLRENEQLRAKGIKAGLKLKPRTSLTLKQVPEPFDSDGYPEAPLSPEELTADDLAASVAAVLSKPSVKPPTRSKYRDNFGTAAAEVALRRLAAIPGSPGARLAAARRPWAASPRLQPLCARARCRRSAPPSCPPSPLRPSHRGSRAAASAAMVGPPAGGRHLVCRSLRCRFAPDPEPVNNCPRAASR